MSPLIAVGGHTRNIGKTSVMAGIIKALPECGWTAVKITQFGHGVCSATGVGCECCLESEHPYAIQQEHHPNRSDSGRFLAAGARRSFWLRTAMGQLQAAHEILEELRASSRNLIVESNSILELMKPDLYLVVLDFARDDFKASSRRFLKDADAYITIERGMEAAPSWKDVAQDFCRSTPRFPVRPPQYVTAGLAAFVRERLLTVSDGAVSRDAPV